MAESDISITLSPVPANDEVSVNYESTSSANKSYRITNFLGQVMTENNLGVKQSGAVAIPLSGYAAGVYFIEFKYGNEVKKSKFIKL